VVQWENEVLFDNLPRLTIMAHCICNNEASCLKCIDKSCDLYVVVSRY
jgi:hypothetical protein